MRAVFAIVLSLLIGVAGASAPNTLAGVQLGQTFNAAAWDNSSGTPGREVTFAGHKAFQFVGLSSGRITDVGLAFIVAHPVTGGMSPAQPGLTTSPTPEAKAEKVAQAVRAVFASEGFKKASGGINPVNGAVEHYCASGKRERTLLVRTEAPGKVSMVMVAIPPQTNCP